MKSLPSLKRFLIVLITVATLLSCSVFASMQPSEPMPGATADDLFEKAVTIIKKYETLHKPKHWPLVGYGHMVQRGEKFSRKKTMSEKDADALLRKDLLTFCKIFRPYGKDSLLLAVLAYNIGPANVQKSAVIKKLKNGDRDIRSNYVAHARYRGKTLPSLQRRRNEEFDSLFIRETVKETLKVEESVGKTSESFPVFRPIALTFPAPDNRLFPSVWRRSLVSSGPCLRGVATAALACIDLRFYP